MWRGSLNPVSAEPTIACLQNAKPEDGSDDVGLTMVGRLVDCVEVAYAKASEDMVDDLAGVSVVLERCSQTPVCELSPASAKSNRKQLSFWTELRV